MPPLPVLPHLSASVPAITAPLLTADPHGAGAQTGASVAAGLLASLPHPPVAGALPAWLVPLTAGLPTLALSLALLALLLLLGTGLGRLLGTHQWGIPEALLAGGLGLLIAPAGAWPLIPPAVIQLWDQLPLILLTLVFASLLLGKPLPALGGLWRPLSAQMLLALTLAFGQYLVAALAVLLLLQPLLGAPSVMACLIEVAYEGGHGSAAAMGPTYARLGLESGEALGLALATVGLLASTLVGGLLVLLGRRFGWVLVGTAPALPAPGQRNDNGISGATPLRSDGGLDGKAQGEVAGAARGLDPDALPAADCGTRLAAQGLAPEPVRADGSRPEAPAQESCASTAAASQPGIASTALTPAAPTPTAIASIATSPPTAASRTAATPTLSSPSAFPQATSAAAVVSASLDRTAPGVPAATGQAAVALTPASFAVNLALTGSAVLIGVLMLEGLRLLAAWQGGLLQMVVDALPVFPLALLGSLLMRLVLERTGRTALVLPKLQARIGTLSADLLITAATACLDLSLLARDWLPLTVLASVGLVWNLAVILLLAPRILPSSWFERGLVEFGQATGVAASGLLLLNMVDPDDLNGSLTPFSIKQLLLQPFLAGGVITVVAPLAVDGWGLPAWSLVCLVLVILWSGLGLWLARSARAVGG